MTVVLGNTYMVYMHIQEHYTYRTTGEQGRSGGVGEKGEQCVPPALSSS